MSGDSPFSSIKIGWTDYRIERWDPRAAASAERYGECAHNERRIRVDFAHGTRQAAATLLHEIMHATCNVWRVEKEDGEERIVTMLEHGLATVWRDNPQIFAWIGANLADGSD